MADLKPYYDAVIEAEAGVQRVANELDEAFREGTEESKKKALELRPALDEAQKKHDEAVSLYEAMQKTNRPNDVAKNFVPITNQIPITDGLQPTIIKRQDYDKMSVLDQAKYIRSGGKVED